MLEITINQNNNEKFAEATTAALTALNDSLALLLGASSKFITEHDDFLLTSPEVRDVSILKKEIKRKIKRVV